MLLTQEAQWTGFFVQRKPFLSLIGWDMKIMWDVSWLFYRCPTLRNPRQHDDDDGVAASEYAIIEARVFFDTSKYGELQTAECIVHVITNALRDTSLARVGTVEPQGFESILLGSRSCSSVWWNTQKKMKRIYCVYYCIMVSWYVVIFDWLYSKCK